VRAVAGLVLVPIRGLILLMLIDIPSDVRTFRDKPIALILSAPI